MTESEQKYAFALMYFLKFTTEDAEKESKRWHSKADQGLVEPLLCQHSLGIRNSTSNTESGQVVETIYLKPTDLKDMQGFPIHVGDKLRNIYKYDVIVKETENGVFYGQLVCDVNHSCKDIPYSLNEGEDYYLIEK